MNTQKQPIKLLPTAVKNAAAKHNIQKHYVMCSFSHFYESHSHVFLVGQDICAVMAKHFNDFVFYNRDSKPTVHSVGQGSMAKRLQEFKLDALKRNAPSGLMKSIIDSVMSSEQLNSILTAGVAPEVKPVVAPSCDALQRVNNQVINPVNFDDFSDLYQ